MRRPYSSSFVKDSPPPPRRGPPTRQQPPSDFAKTFQRHHNDEDLDSTLYRENLTPDRFRRPNRDNSQGRNFRPSESKPTRTKKKTYLDYLDRSRPADYAREPSREHVALFNDDEDEVEKSYPPVLPPPPSSDNRPPLFRSPFVAPSPPQPTRSSSDLYDYDYDYYDGWNSNNDGGNSRRPPPPRGAASFDSVEIPFLTPAAKRFQGFPALVAKESQHHDPTSFVPSHKVSLPTVVPCMLYANRPV